MVEGEFCADPEDENVMVWLDPAATVKVAGDTVTPAGTPVTDTATVAENPLAGVTDSVEDWLGPPFDTTRLDGFSDRL
jgi:hypothetical protein